MKIKKEGEIISLTESDIKRIVAKKLSLEEGLRSTLKGIGGMFKGTGYSYTKYAYELSGALKELNEELEETIIEVGKIVGKSNKSKMSNISYDRLSTHVKDALDAYQMVIDVNDVIIEDLDFSVSNNREDERSVDNVEPQFDRGK
jgi:acetylglutamate kinase